MLSDALVGKDYPGSAYVDLHEDNHFPSHLAHTRSEGAASGLDTLFRFAAFLSPAFSQLSRPNHNRGG